MRWSQKLYKSLHAVHISRFDRDREFQLERLLTTGSSMASVKLSGGDIFNMFESAFNPSDEIWNVK